MGLHRLPRLPHGESHVAAFLIVAEMKKKASKGGGGAKKAFKFANSLGKPLPKAWLGGLSQADACTFAPYGTKVYRDDVNNWWHAVIVRDSRRISRSWVLQLCSVEGACLLAVQWCWEQYMLSEHLHLHECPVQGLFKAVAKAPEWAAGSSSDGAKHTG